MTLSIQVDKTVSWVPEVLCGIYCGPTKRLTTLLRYITNSYLAYVAERVSADSLSHRVADRRITY